MTAPTTDDWNKLVRLGRYFARHPRVVNWYKYQEASGGVHRLRSGLVQKDKKINVRRVHPQRAAHA